MTLAIVKQQWKRESLLHFRQLRLIINSSLFFLMIMVFFPLTLPADQALLKMIAPGLIWTALLLAMLLSAERMFQQDYEDGVIEQWLVSGDSLSLRVFIKVLCHWILNLIPILILCPLLAVLFKLHFSETLILMLSLILGSPTIIFLCALAAVFGMGVKQRGLFMALILLPLTLPVMVFGSGTLSVAFQGFPILGYLCILLAISVVAVAFLPFAIAAVMKISLVD